MSSFSNDDSIASFREAMRRVDTPEYQGARNRVAIIIGESALATNVLRIPEKTIVLLNNDPGQVGYMGNYAFYLQMADNRTMWLEGITPGDSEQAKVHNEQRQWQEEWWKDKKERTALLDDELFEAAQAAALQKAFIPWRGDITNETDTERLGAALRKYHATVTLLNLSNVIACSALIKGEQFSTAAAYADVLAKLPATPTVPILTTSRYPVDDYTRHIVHATGPFYGLNALRTRGGDSMLGPVALHPTSRVAQER